MQQSSLDIRVPLDSFASQWELEDLPACEVGLRILKKFAEVQPTAFETAMRFGLVEVPKLNDPIFSMIPEWQPFLEHVESCPWCNETGYVPPDFSSQRVYA